MGELEKGNEAFLEGRFNDAIRHYTTVLAVIPNDAVVLCNRGAANLELELFRAALKDSQSAITSSPSYVPAFVLKGRIEAKQGKVADAIKTWTAGCALPHCDVHMLASLKALIRACSGDSTGVFFLPSPAAGTPAPAAVPKPVLTPASSAAADPDGPPPLVASNSPPRRPVPSPTALPASSPSSQAKATSNAAAAAAAAAMAADSGIVMDAAQAAALKRVAARMKPRKEDEEEESPAAGGLRIVPGGHGGNKPIDPKSLAASAIVAARGMVQYGAGEPSIDEKIANGYLQVNTGNWAGAVAHFSSLLQANPKLVAAYLGRGTAQALLGDLDAASRDFSSAIVLDANCVEAWKRRGQTRAAKGADEDALADLSEALRISTSIASAKALPGAKPKLDHEVLHQRGLVYYKMKNYTRALADFEAAAEAATDSLDTNSAKLSLNHLGLCLNTVGQSRKAITVHRRAIKLDDKFRESFANVGQAFKELGDLEHAVEYFQRAVALDPQYAQAYHMMAMTKFGGGKHKEALQDFQTALSIDPNLQETRYMCGIVMQNLGLFRKAIEYYDDTLKRKPDHVSWYTKQITLYCHHHLDLPFHMYNPDAELHPTFKEAWCKRLAPATLPEDYVEQNRLNTAIPDVDQSLTLTADERRLIAAADTIGVRLQYNTPGFLPNARQHRSFGIAILTMAQILRAHWENPSAPSPFTSSVPSAKSHRKFGYRDLFDIAVKHRQLSEPNDPVWYVDQLTPEQFAEGFGSHTPMVTGHTNVVRYSPNAPRAIQVMKDVMLAQMGAHSKIDEEKKAKIKAATTHQELFQVWGRDFWCVTPCSSTLEKGTPGAPGFDKEGRKLLEGTRLTIQAVPPEGFEFSIRTPGTPPRWQDFDRELAHVWSLLEEAVAAQPRSLDRISDLILTLCFYWYNFMPLSRGTAAVGYMTLISLFLSLDFEVTRAAPDGHQVDWEGILGPSPKEFIAAVGAWMYPARTPSTLLHTLPSVMKVWPTARHLIRALNYPKQQQA